MTIDIMYNASENAKINKSLISIANITGTLRNETSIMAPTILINGDIASLKNANYMHIPDFGRYYFITDIRSIRDSLVEISGKVDVLQTYASQILNLNAIIKRQENDWNLYLDDGSFKVYSNPDIITKEFPNGFVGEEFVFAVAGG